MLGNVLGMSRTLQSMPRTVKDVAKIPTIKGSEVVVHYSFASKLIR